MNLLTMAVLAKQAKQKIVQETPINTWTPPSADLVGWWYGNKTTLTGTWENRSQDAKHLSLLNSPTLSADGITLNAASSQSARFVPETSATSIPCTIAAWFKRAPGSERGAFLSYGGESNGNQGIAIGYGAETGDFGTDGHYLNVQNFYVKYVLPTTPIQLDENWHHYAASHDGGYVNIYYDGVLVKRLYTQAKSTYGKPIIQVGNTKVYKNYYSSGSVDDVLVYNRVLTIE